MQNVYILILTDKKNEDTAVQYIYFVMPYETVFCQE